MPTPPPTIRKTAWISIIPQLTVMGIIIFCYHLFITSLYLKFMLGALTYLIISNVLERGLTHNHRKGIQLSRSGKYAEAIDEYKMSYDFFRKHSWIDKYRYLTMLSSSKYSYTEMALTNIAFCYAHSGDVASMAEYYQKTLELYPDNDMAKKALDLLASYENKAE